MLGAVIFGKGKGTATDFNGNYSFSIPEGERNIQVSYVGYKPITKAIRLKGELVILDFKLKTILLNEVSVVADIAIDRETPVAFPRFL